MSDRKAVIKNADMSEEMQQDAVDCATQALEKYNIEKVREKENFSSHFPLPLPSIFPFIFPLPPFQSIFCSLIIYFRIKIFQ